jgi:hypothetical protein
MLPIPLPTLLRVVFLTMSCVRSANKDSPNPQPSRYISKKKYFFYFRDFEKSKILKKIQKLFFILETLKNPKNFQKIFESL